MSCFAGHFDSNKPAEPCQVLWGLLTCARVESQPCGFLESLEHCHLSGKRCGNRRSGSQDPCQVAWNRLHSAETIAVHELLLRIPQLARLALFDCKNVPARPSWHRTLCGFCKRPVYVQATTMTPTISPPSLIVEVRIERRTWGWRWWCGAGLPQLSLRDFLDWPVRSAGEGFHFLLLANVLCPFSA